MVIFLSIRSLIKLRACTQFFPEDTLQLVDIIRRQLLKVLYLP